MSRGPSRARQLGYILPASSSCRVVWPRRDPSSRARLINWTMDAALQRRSESDSKTRGRVLPLGEELRDLLLNWVLVERADKDRYPGAKRTPYVFVSEDGKPIGLRTVG